MDFEIKTSKSKEEALKIIAENTNQGIFDCKYFSGKIENDSFRIKRAFRLVYTKGISLSAILTGNVYENGNKTLVRVKSSYTIFDRIILTIYWVFAIVMCIVVPFDTSPSIPISTPFFMLIGGVFFHSIFKYDENASIRKLRELLA